MKVTSIVPTFSVSLLALFAFVLLRVGFCLFTSQRCLDVLTSLAITRDVICEFLVFFPLVVHCNAAQREWSYEFR